MKEKELRKIGTCKMCGKGIGQSQLPLFWRVRIRRYGVKMGAVTRQQGLTMMLGGHGLLAQVMGPDEDMAEIMSDVEVTICEDCCCKQIPIAVLADEGE